MYFSYVYICLKNTERVLALTLQVHSHKIILCWYKKYMELLVMQELLICINVSVLVSSDVCLFQDIIKLTFVFPFHSKSHKKLNVLFLLVFLTRNPFDCFYERWCPWVEWAQLIALFPIGLLILKYPWAQRQIPHGKIRR